MGDTGLFGDMKLIGEYYKPDLLLVPIGGHYVMDPKDAAYATKELIKPKMALPMHYATNPFLKGTPAEFKAALGQTLDPGDRHEPGRQEDVLSRLLQHHLPDLIRTAVDDPFLGPSMRQPGEQRRPRRGRKRLGRRRR